LLVHPVILLSDVCWFMVVFGLVLVVGLAKRHPSYQRSFQMILSHSLGMISSIVLLCYVSITVLDSMHFKSRINDQNQVISVLDRLLLPMLIHDEKSYSAPMSRHLLSKESVWRDGKMQIAQCGSINHTAS
jgi:peptide/nickel transport system permease protein